MDTKNQIKKLTILVLCCLLISSLLYLWITRLIPGADVNMAAREIETADKLWLNGYLGHFFRFNYFTLISWVLLPQLVYDLYNIRKANTLKKAFLVIYLLSLVLIGVKGYFNSRYSLTLYPISVVYLILGVNSFFKRQQLVNVLNLAAFVIIGVCFLGFANEIYVWKLKHKSTESEGTVEERFYTKSDDYVLFDQSSSNTSILQSFYNAIVKDKYPSYKYKKQSDTGYKTVEQFDIYDALIHRFNKTKGKVLVNNFPSVFYHTNIKGVYYWAGDDLIFDDKGRYFLFTDRTIEESLKLLKKLGVEYVYTSLTYNKYSTEFNNFLFSNCTLLAEGKGGYQLFRVNY